MEYSDLKNSIISYCNGSFDKRTYDITIEEALNEIKKELFFNKVTEYRNTKDKSKKQNLKAYIFSGKFSKAENKSIINYHKICVLDFDDIKDDIYIVKDTILKCDYVFSAWLSPSGNGIKALIAFDFSDFEVNDVSDFIDYHKIAYKQFLDKNFFYPYELDSTGCNISRLCYTSIDKDLVIKNKIIPFHVQKNETSYKAKNKRPEKQIRKLQAEKKVCSEKDVLYMPGHKSNFNRYIYKSIYKYLKNRNLSITERYDEWFLIGQAIANTFSYSIGKEYFLKLCRLDGTKHDEEESKKKIVECYQNRKSFNGNKVGITTIIKAAQKKGWKHKGIQEY